jgi:DNA 3'-phosphatase
MAVGPLSQKPLPTSQASSTSTSSTSQTMSSSPAVRNDALGRQRFAPSFAPPTGPVKVAFFDADSTLRVAPSGKVSANGPTDVALLPGVADTLKGLHEAGYLIAIVSNQNGVEYGHVSLNDADAALQHTISLIRQAGGEVHTYDFAEAKGARRKPDIGMALDLEAQLTSTFGPHATIDKAQSIMVGDSAWSTKDVRPDGTPGKHFSNSDRLFAQNLGVAFHEPADFFGWRALGVDGFDDHNALVRFADQRKSAAQALLGTDTKLTAPTTQAPSTSSALHVRLNHR